MLQRGEPVEITVVNRLAEPTAIHWHGIELDSYYDGVHGWSGIGKRITPLIEPGGTFPVRFTPPRTGPSSTTRTFMMIISSRRGCTAL